MVLAPLTAKRYRSQIEAGKGLDSAQAMFLLDEVERLDALLNQPQIADFIEAMKHEAAHQRERWGEDHDKSKHPHDWITTAVHLLGKAAKAFWDGDREKYLHHIVTTAAMCANWHARERERS